MRAPLRDITNIANAGVKKDTIDRILKMKGFRLRKSRKKPWFRKSSKKIRFDFAKRRINYPQSFWDSVVWIDECTIEFGGYSESSRVRVLPGEELEEENLAPTFKSGRTTCRLWGAITKGKKCYLVRVRQRDPSEKRRQNDRLGLDSYQYATEIHRPHLIPFLQSP